jgi:hypothetical protein
MEEQEQEYAEQLTEFLEEDTITVDERMELDQFLDEDSDLTYEQADAIEKQVRKELKLPPRNWKQEYEDSCAFLVDTYKRRVPKEELEKLQITYVDSRRVSLKEAQAIANQVGLKERSSKALVWFSFLLILVIGGGVAYYFFPEQTAEIMEVPKQISRTLADKATPTTPNVDSSTPTTPNVETSPPTQNIDISALAPATPNVDTTTPARTTQNIATSNQEPTIQNVGIPTVAAYLDELGYFNGDFRQATLSEVQAALKLFQGDLNVPQTGELDKFIWNKLQAIRLSPHRQEALK